MYRVSQPVVRFPNCLAGAPQVFCSISGTILVPDRSYIPTSFAGSNDNLSFAKSIIVCAVEPAQVTIINQMLGLMVRRRDGGLQPAARAFNVEGAAVDERNKAEGTQQMLEKLKPLRTIYRGDNSLPSGVVCSGFFKRQAPLWRASRNEI